MPNMPNLVGLELYSAQAALQSAGILVPASIGYFGIWPIGVLWQKSTFPSATVLTQSIASGNPTTVNTPLTLGVSQYRTAVAYP